MILQALCGYYERLASSDNDSVAMPGWAVTPVSACITIDANGNVVNVLSLIDEKKPKQLVTPQQPKRAGQRPNAAFLCENSNFLFGIYKDKKGADYRFEASRVLHSEILGNVDDAGAHAVMGFFEKRVKGSCEYSGVDTAPLEMNGNIVFRLVNDADYIHNRPVVKAAWERYNTKSLENSEVMQCLVTGIVAPIARLHGNLGGFGQDKPTIVGFNQPSFESYHKSQGANAPVSESAAFRYVTALNALIADSQHIVRMADTKVVFWAERDALTEENFMYTLFGGKSDETVVRDEVSARKIGALLSCVRNGKSPDMPGIDSNVTFHILGISAAKTRLVVRFFYSDTFGNLLDRIGQHYRDIEIDGADWDSKLTTPYIILIETAVAHKSDNITPTLEGALMRSIITGLPYPHSLYNLILTRVRADKNISHTRVGVIKGFLNRNARFNDKQEMITVALNTEEKNTGYLLGRLFAVLEKAQYDALGNVNATIVDKYLNSALATPQTVFPVLLPLFEKHVSKSEKYYSKQLVQRIVGEFTPLGFPQTLNAEDQGRFLIGYYHQRQDFYKGKPQEQKTEDENMNGGNENE
ncbi:type I-C CRISPR-associated protein Cas8c/Csd1 [Synergistales bacterium]|nr:type I-C CRISPR-associated protein Cas8c/Csd1 [Synergistales bacterium]